MFQFPSLPSSWLCIHHAMTAHYCSRIPPFGHPRVRIFAPDRGLSQLVTSFFGSWCQVILPTLLLAWPLNLFKQILGSSNYIRIRDFWNWSFTLILTLLVRFRKNLSTYNLGLTLFLISSRLYLLYHRLNISSLKYSGLHCSVFKVQVSPLCG